DVVARTGQSLAAAAIPIAAHPANDRLLQRRGVVPARRRQMPRRALERLAEAEPGIADRDDDDPPAEPLRPALALYGAPSALAGLLENFLPDLRERHREADDRLRIQMQLARDDLFRAGLHPTDDVVHVGALRDRRDVEQRVRLGAIPFLRVGAVEV